MTKYIEIYNGIKEKINNNYYNANDMLPSGQELSNEYNCSILTVTKALDMLVNEGFIVRKRGLGTFVKKIINNEDEKVKISGFNGYYKTSRDLLRKDITSIVEKFDIIKSDENIASNLNINVGDFVYYIIRVRLYKGEPRIVEYTWMPINIIKGLEIKHLENSIYYYITKELKLKIQSAHVSINAKRPNEIEKKYFNMNDTDFVCEIEQIAYLDSSEIFEYSLSHHIPKYFDFKTNIIKELY